MHKKHYIKIAAILSGYKDRMKDDGDYGVICTAFCRMMMDDNPNFDPIKFYEACGYTIHNKNGKK